MQCLSLELKMGAVKFNGLLVRNQAINQSNRERNKVVDNVKVV
jgi:hypothetical protein